MRRGVPDDPDFLYFAFGSNLDAARLRIHCRSARFVLPARLEGYRLAFSVESARTWHGGVGDIIASPDDEVWGALWVIDGEHSHPLDVQEGLFREPPVYRRITVDVTTAAGDAVRCRCYQVVTPARTDILPSPAYKQTIVRGARACGLPPHYIAKLEAITDNGYAGGGPS